MLLKKYPLIVSEKVDEPSNINWENLDCSPEESFFRKCIVFFLLILIMFITFFVIIGANIVKPVDAENCD